MVVDHGGEPNPPPAEVHGRLCAREERLLRGHP